MAKPLFQDIVPPDRKSIKKIPIPERSREKRPGAREPGVRERPIARPVARPTQRVKEVEPEELVEAPRKAVARPQKARRKKAPIIFSIVSVILIAIIIFFFIPKAKGATITLTPHGQVVSVNATFTASKDPTADLPYQVAVYQKDGKLTVPATGDEFAQTKASGIIRIFNNYSSASQALVAGTRFQTPNGLIFKTSQPVVIAGKSGSTPGSVDVAVSAEKYGADYNVGLADFTIPGFKGDPKYDKIYGRSTVAMDGGFSGNRKKVDDTQVAAARQKIRDELQASLIRQMQQNIPENFIFPESAYFIEYESLPNTTADNGVQLTERATFHGIMFKSQDLAQAISTKIGSVNHSTTGLQILDTKSLIFANQSLKGTSTAAWNSDPLTFGLSGTTTIVSAIDTDKLKDELAGKPRKGLNAVLAGYPGVAKAEVVMRPFWQQSFPTDKTEIIISVGKTPVSP